MFCQPDDVTYSEAGEPWVARTEYDLNWITSVDDHIVEPPHVWRDRVPSKYKDIAPRVITDDNGREVWAYEDIRQEREDSAPAPAAARRTSPP